MGMPAHSDWTTSKRPSRISVPARANPLAKLVFAEMAKAGVTYQEMEFRAGILISTIKAWRSDNSPGLLSIEACLGSLGWALVPVPRMERIPENIRAGLDALNAEWAREEPLLHHLMASACLAPILVGDDRPPVTIEIKPTRRSRKASEPNPYQPALFAEGPK